MARSKFADCCCVRFGSFSANRHIKKADGIPGPIHLWAFDLLAFNGPDLRLQPLVKRQARLQALLERFGRRLSHCPNHSKTARRCFAWPSNEVSRG